MGKYNRIPMKSENEKPWKVHPVWRGIGCLLMILIPVMSYAGAMLLVRQNMRSKWIQVPAELASAIDFSPVYRFVPVLKPLLSGLGKIYYMDLLVSVLLMVVAFGLMTVVYSLFYTASGGAQRSPLDAPPVRRSPKRGTR